MADGEALCGGKQCIAHVKGPLQGLLQGERIALNIMSRASGVATMYEFVYSCLRYLLKLLDFLDAKRLTRSKKNNNGRASLLAREKQRQVFHNILI